jgi:hypothetical protein
MHSEYKRNKRVVSAGATTEADIKEDLEVGTDAIRI